jgi:hypothetical protein
MSNPSAWLAPKAERHDTPADQPLRPDVSQQTLSVRKRFIIPAKRTLLPPLCLAARAWVGRADKCFAIGTARHGVGDGQ